MAPHTNTETKARIVTKLEDGWSYAAVAAHFNVSKTTVVSIRHRWIYERTLKRKVGSGRPKISTPEEDRALLDHLHEHPFSNAREASILTNFPGRKTTTWERIRISPLSCRVAANKTALTEQQKQSRLLFALNNINRNQDFWDRVIFSDEKIFQSSRKGKILVYRPDNERFNPTYVNHHRAAGHFSVNVWAWISSRGMGIVWRIQERFNAQSYVNILENVMMPSVEQLYPDGEFIFQHDNCPVHTANIVTQWMQANNVETLPWASYSPDVNPIENIWGHIVKILYKQNFMPLNPDHLWEGILDAWEHTAERLAFITPFINSMNRRLASVIEVNGDMTKY